MEDLGLVSRKRMQQDQRRVLVSITPKSNALVEHIAPLSKQTYQELERQLGRDSVAALYAQLDRLLETLQALEDQEKEP